jgi:hypothetical protein
MSIYINVEIDEKYYFYYHSSIRTEVSVCKNTTEALPAVPCKLLDTSKIKKDLLIPFPDDRKIMRMLSL